MTIAFAMNGDKLSLLNGFPLRLIKPGWYSTYRVKMLCDVEVLDKPDDNFWMTTAYKIPDAPRANITPDQAGVEMVAIYRMVPRSFFTNIESGTTFSTGAFGEIETIRYTWNVDAPGRNVTRTWKWSPKIDTVFTTTRIGKATR